MKTMFIKILRIYLIGLFIMLMGSIVYSQKTQGTSINENSSFTNGNIVSSNEALLKGQLSLSQSQYDEKIVGVYYKETNPSETSVNKKIPVKNEGICNVIYNDENGAIRKGDPVTSSSTPGVAMKATRSGIILGIATEDAQTPSGILKVRILIQYLKQ